MHITLRLVITVGLVAAAVETGSAQWINYPDPGIPRTADGKPNLAAPAPRFPDGRIDLSGVWQPDPKATVGAPPVGQTLGEDPVIRLRTADGSPYPLLPAAEADYKRRIEAGELGPAAQCLPHTITDYYLVPTVIKFVHTPRLTIMLFEEYQHFRQVFTDGRPFPDAFVIETAGFNTRGWLDVTPLPHSEQLRTTEQFRRPNFGTLQVDVMIDDPATFSRRWNTQTISFKLLPDTDFIEYICENEKDVKAITGR